MGLYDINVDAVRSRQKRLLDKVQHLGLDAVIVTQTEHVQYLAGPRFGWVYSPAAVLFADGRLTLVAPNEAPEVAAADKVLTYEAQWLCTLRNDQRAACSQVLLEDLKQETGLTKIGVEFSSFSHHLSASLDAQLVDIEPTLYQMRRSKDQDELALIRKAIAGTEKMYAKAKEIVTPGINELEVFNQLQAAAVEEYGEMLTGTGNDYASGAKGGPPRDRKAEDGELYILDLGPAFKGYFADNSRAFAVNGKPTDEQQEAWQHIMKVFAHVEFVVKPGKSCKELFHEVCEILKQAPIGVFDHHLGHGIGLFPHEGPHLNSHWDDQFEVGDFSSVFLTFLSNNERIIVKKENYLEILSFIDNFCTEDFYLTCS